jgi:hypothetical protein
MRWQKAGEEHCAACFSVSYWLPRLQVVVPEERRAGERVLHAVHAGAISPAAGEIIALAPKIRWQN